MRRLSAWTIGVHVALVLAIGIVVLLARAHRDLDARYQRLAERSAWRTLAARADSASALGGVAPRVIGLSLDALDATVAYAREHGLRFPVAQFPTRRDQALYRARSVPLILVINDENRVAYSRMGVLTSPAALDSVWRATVGEHPPRPAPPTPRTARR
ncbi:MAG: peroxiredoxin family protein [Gemmatimonadaceae bacterium]|jgi:hypothetical protein